MNTSHDFTDEIARRQEIEGHASVSRDEAIKAIRSALKRRSGKTWSVKGGRGTGYGWITISAPPARCEGFGYMTEADCRELTDLLGQERAVHMQGETIPASTGYRIAAIAAAEGRVSSAAPTPYWD
jgi:hypothetical protein